MSAAPAAATNSRAAAAAARAAQEEKQKEVAYVRGEKVADEQALEKLQRAYGGGPTRTDNSARKKIWVCGECQFHNFDVRDVCGNCLAPNPSAISQEKRHRNDLRPPRATLDPGSKIVTIGGRCYRQFVQNQAGAGSRVKFQTAAPAAAATANDDQDDEPSCRPGKNNNNSNNHGDNDDDDDDEYDDTGLGGNNNNEEELDDGVTFDSLRQCFILKIKVPRRFWKFVYGKQHKTVQEIERMTGATLKMKEDPESNDSNNDNTKRTGVAIGDSADDEIEICGPNRACIHAARLRVDSIVLENESRVEYTHFISIPLATTPESRSAFGGYLQEMIRICGSDEGKNLDPFMFQAPGRLHLTLLMLRLHSQEEREKAKSLMTVVGEMLKSMFTAGDKISFRSLNYMNDDPTEVHVLYLEPARDAPASKKLVDLVQQINSLFIDSGLALPKDIVHNEKLHATVVNSKWRSGAVQDATADNYSEHTSAKHGPRVAFDATEILRMFGDCSGLGAHKLQRVDLSVLGAGNASDGYYARECSVYFP